MNAEKPKRIYYLEEHDIQTLMPILIKEGKRRVLLSDRPAILLNAHPVKTHAVKFSSVEAFLNSDWVQDADILILRTLPKGFNNNSLMRVHGDASVTLTDNEGIAVSVYDPEQ